MKKSKSFKVNTKIDPRERSELYITVHQLVELFVNIIESKDKFTKNHSEIVAEIGFILAKTYGLPNSIAELIHIAGHLHDIGKIFIPRSILKKPGPLTSQEYEIIKQHPVKGAELLRPIKVFEGPGGITEMVLFHHERWDGKGYPFGLKKERIPLGARILAIADAFSAMICERPYRKPLTFDAAFEEIKKESGSQFDPDLARIFLDMYDKILLMLKEKFPTVLGGTESQDLEFDKHRKKRG